MRIRVLSQVSAEAPPHPGWRWLNALLLSWLLMGACVSSASAQYRFDNWTTENGLPQNSVLAITQTRDGYLWLATYNGLVRFDGVRFTVFDKNNTKAFSTSRISDLGEDATGALWIGTTEGGVLRYQNGVFTAFTREQGLPHNNVMVRGIQSSPDGVPLILTDYYRKKKRSAFIGSCRRRSTTFSNIPERMKPSSASNTLATKFK